MTIKAQLMAAGRLWNRRRLKVSELLRVADWLLKARKNKDLDLMITAKDRALCLTAIFRHLGMPFRLKGFVHNPMLGLNYSSLIRGEKGSIHFIAFGGLSEPNGTLWLLDWTDIFPAGPDTVCVKHPKRSAVFVGVKEFLAE